MKRLAICLTAVPLAFLSLASCEKEQNGSAKSNSPIFVEDISLDKKELTIEVGKTAALTATVYPEDAEDKSINWVSSEPDVASVSDNGEVRGYFAGETIISATTTDGGLRAECTVTVKNPTIDGYEYVDLGLSVKWAACNICAESPEEDGDHFAWGEISPRDYCTEENSLTYGIELPDISGDPQYDAARANWGGSWRLPTHEECKELALKCDWKWIEGTENNGMLVTGPSGNSIYFPAAGYVDYFWLDRTHGGYYWSSTPTEGDTTDAYSLIVTSTSKGIYTDNDYSPYQFRYMGYCIRPVTD